MRKWWIWALLLGAVVLLLGLAVGLEHGRAGVRVTAGIEGLEASPAADASGLAAPDGAESSARTPVTGRAARASAPELEVLVRRADGRPLAFAEVLAYRGEELRSAGKTDEDGCARLLPFPGAGTLRVRWVEDEIARLALPAGAGRHAVVVPDGAVVAGIVRLEGAPREGVWLELDTGPQESWTGRRIRTALEELGLSEPRRRRRTSSAEDGSFRFEWLPSDWSGALRLAEDSSLRFASGSRRLALAGPDAELVLALRRRGKGLELRGRAVLEGAPVPGTYWHAELGGESWSSLPSGACDAEGRFTLSSDAEEDGGVAWLELYHPAAGRRMLRAPADRLEGELGDVELVPNRALAFVVRAEDGAPVAGATASPLDSEFSRGVAAMLRDLRGEGFPGNGASGPDGKGVLHWPLTEATEVRFEAPGFATATLRVGPESPLPIEAVLARGATLAVLVRAADGTLPPPGLEVRLRAREAPLRGPGGRPGAPSATCSWGQNEDEHYVHCKLDEGGGLRFTGLATDVRMTLALTDGLGFALAPPQELVLAAGEERTLELTCADRPRRVLVRVRDALGRPLPRAWVRLKAAGVDRFHLASAMTDRAGLSSFESVVAPSVDIEVWRPGFEEARRDGCRLPEDEAMLEVVLAHDWWPW